MNTTPDRDFFVRCDELLATGKTDELERKLREGSGRFPDDAEVDYWCGRLAEAKNDLEAAVGAYQKAVDKSPLTALYHFALAQAFDHKLTVEAHLGDMLKDDSAVGRTHEHWEQAIALAPEQATYQALYADFLVRQKQFAPALTAISKAFQMNPVDENIRVIRTRIHLKIGCALAVEASDKAEEGLGYLKMVLADIPHHLDANLFAGVCCRKLRRFDEGIRYLETCLQQQTGGKSTFLFMPFYELAKLFFAMDNAAAAEAVAQKGLAIDPQCKPLIDLLKNPRASAGEAGTGHRVDENPRNQESERMCRFSPEEKERVFYPALEKLVALCGKDLPDAWKSLAPELVAALKQPATELPAQVLESLRRMEVGTCCRTDSQRDAVARLLFEFLRESFWGSPTLGFPVFLQLLPEYLRFVLAQPHVPVIADQLAWLFEVVPHLLLECYEPTRQTETHSGPQLSLYCRALADFTATERFLEWAQGPAAQAALTDWTETTLRRLSKLAQSRRFEPFCDLLGLVLHLPAVLNGFQEKLRSLLVILPLARLLFRTSGREDRIEEVLRKIAAKAPTAVRACLEGYVKTYLEGKIPHQEIQAQEDENLTVEFVYRTAFEEILGDGVITEDEKTVLVKLQEYLQIPQHVYKRIFSEVIQGRKLQVIPATNRNFSADEFLFKILSKTVEDGKITEEEKEIIKNVCSALVTDKGLVQQAFQRAKTARLAHPLNLDDELPETRRYRALLQAVHECLRIKKVFSINRLQRSWEKMQKIFEGAASEQGVLSGNAAMSAIPGKTVTNFFYEPDVYPLPILAVVTGDADLSRLRLQMKGSLLEPVFLENVQELVKNQSAMVGENYLLLENEGLDLEIPLGTVLFEDDFDRFLAGIIEKKGQYAVTLVRYEDRQPVCAVVKSGFLETTARLRKGHNLLSEGRFEQALSYFHDVYKSNKEAHGVLWSIGLTHKTMAFRGQDPAQNYPLALKYYAMELEIDPNSVRAMNGMGVVCKQLHKWDEAVTWLEKARRKSPTCIPVLATLTTTLYSRDLALGKDFPQPPDYLIQYLGDAYHVFPDHPLVVQLLQEYNRIFRTDFRRMFRSLDPSVDCQ